MAIDGEALRGLLRHRLYTQRDLAKASGIAPSSIGVICSGAEPLGPIRLEKLKKGMQTLGFTKAEVRRVLGRWDSIVPSLNDTVEGGAK